MTNGGKTPDGSGFFREIERIFRRAGESRVLRTGDALFMAGDPARGIFLLERGEIRVYQMDREGKEVEVVRLGPGDILGEAVLFAGAEYPFYAQAVLESRALFLSRNALFQEIDHDPAAGRAFLRLLSDKCLTLNRKIEALGIRTIRQRLIRYLINLCPGDGNCRIELDRKKGELARLLGTAGETLSRNLRQLQDDGLIRIDGRRIQILNCGALRAEARDM
jgi:CRP/FNR family transcriptional regulator